MKNDILVILWKEWKVMLKNVITYEYLSSNILTIVLFSIVIPILIKSDLVSQPNSFVFWIGVIFISNLLISTSSFVSEREDRCLLTLLSSRVQEFSILIGKLIFCIGYSFMHCLFCVFTLLITYFFMIQAGSIHMEDLEAPFYSYIFLFVTCIFVSIISSFIGVNISIKSLNVEIAQSNMRKYILCLFIILSIVYNCIKYYQVENFLSIFKISLSFYIIVAIFCFFSVVNSFNKYKYIN